MKKNALILIGLLTLTGCETNEADKEAIKVQAKADVKTAEDNAQRHTMRVANNVRDQTKKTMAKMREWWLEPLPEPVIPAVPPRYCYQVMQDINCYRQPMPGMTHRLIGYQGDGAAPPPASQTEPLPKLASAENKTVDAYAKARVKAAQPVFVNPPLTPKEDKSANSAEEAAAIGNEPLPNPALSPQL